MVRSHVRASSLLRSLMQNTTVGARLLYQYKVQSARHKDELEMATPGRFEGLDGRREEAEDRSEGASG